MRPNTAGQFDARGSHRGHRSGRESPSLDRVRAVLAVLRGDRPLWRRTRGATRPAPRKAKAPREHWIARRGLTVGRLAGLAVMALLACWLVWRIVADTGALLLAASEPAVALRLNGDAVPALNRLAAQLLAADDGDVARAQQILHEALRTSPLDQQALYLLAQAARRNDDPERAEALMRMAGERSWRNLGVQIALIESDIGKRQFDEALTHIDAALRQSPELQYRDNHLLGVLAAYVLDPQALESLQRFLATAPPWREWFLEELAARLVKPEPLDSIFAALAASDHPPTHKERLIYANRLVKERRYVEAQRLWLTDPAGIAGVHSSYPYNRDFRTEPDGSPFDWRVLARHGADVRLQPGDGTNPGLLVAQFSGSRVEMQVQQLMLLRPGRYVFAGEMKAQDLRANRGVRWRLFCADNAGVTLAETALATDSMPWTRFAVPFEVPQSGCTAQWLRFENPARVPSEREIEGQVSYRSLAIDPVDVSKGLRLLWRWSN